MARRIKEDAAVHRRRIAEAAGTLFQENGIDNTSVDNVASFAGYSKATLYVYFKNKEEIIGYLVLMSMEKLKSYIEDAISSGSDYKTRFMDICHAIERYEEEYPYYFSLSLDFINIDFSSSKCLDAERETFRVGEEINEMLIAFIKEGMKAGSFREMEKPHRVVFALWGMLSGLVQLGRKKEEYVSRMMDISKSEFLRNGFEVLYEAIRAH